MLSRPPFGFDVMNYSFEDAALALAFRLCERRIARFDPVGECNAGLLIERTSRLDGIVLEVGNGVRHRSVVTFFRGIFDGFCASHDQQPLTSPYNASAWIEQLYEF